MHVQREHFLVSDDRTRLDLEAIQRLMESSYWAAERPRPTTEASVKNSLCFGLYDVSENRQIGFLRVVTDYVTFAWLCDVVIERGYRGKGLGKWMLEAVLNTPELRCLGRWMLATHDAHDFYREYGFTEMAHPEYWMERIRSKDDCTCGKPAPNLPAVASFQTACAKRTTTPQRCSRRKS